MASSPPGSASYGAAAIVDIVSFGYRNLVKNLVPLAIMAAPLALFCGLGIGLTSQFVRDLASGGANSMDARLMMGAGGLVIMIFSWAFYYLDFAILRYARDWYQDRADTESPLRYLAPNQELLGFLGISLVFAGGLIVALVVVVIGFFLLVLPGLVAMGGLFYLIIRLYLVTVVYLQDPSIGVSNAFKRTWPLTEGNFWRTAGIIVLMAIVQYIVMLPFSIVQAALSAAGVMMPAFKMTPLYPVLIAASYMLMYWAQAVVGLGGMSFIRNRYYYDLTARSGGVQPVLAGASGLYGGVRFDNPAAPPTPPTNQWERPASDLPPQF